MTRQGGDSASGQRLAAVIERTSASAAMLKAIEQYERRFDVVLETLVYFPQDLLAELHRPGPLSANVVEASPADERVIGFLETITAVANQSSPLDDDRRAYLKMLESIYACLLGSPSAAARQADLVIAPAREGEILANRIGCVPAAALWLPHEKRIGFEGGLIVGVVPLPSSPPATRIVAIDGVMASGVTLMAALQLAAAEGAEVEVFTCHSTMAGVQALDRYAAWLGLGLSLHVGHISGLLNESFYAVDPDDPTQVVLGDVGDMISPVALPVGG